MRVVNYKVGFTNKYTTPIEIYTEKQVNVYIDEFNPEPIPKGTTRIVMLEEPLKGDLFNLVQEFRDYYDYVLTYEDEILRTNPKAIFFRCADTWVQGYVSPKKEFNVSTVIGGKNDLRMQGYNLRHEVWKNQDKITIPKKFYLSSNSKLHHVDYSDKLVLGNTKTPLFDSMFHISIENRSMKHYFSEKLLDCFQTRTIPIYYGCLNIDEYFNPDGIINVRNIDDIIDICNNLTPDVYEWMLPAAEENYKSAQNRINYFDQLKSKLIELIKTI